MPVNTTDEGTCEPLTTYTTLGVTMLLPVIALTDEADAQILFDLLNDASVKEEDAERRARMHVLMIATHAELARLRTSSTHTGDTP